MLPLLSAPLLHNHSASACNDMKLPLLSRRSLTSLIKNVFLVIGVLFCAWAVLSGLATVLHRCRQSQADTRETKAQIVAMNLDRLRLEDAANILLALQEFRTRKGVFPSSLDHLKQEGFLDTSTRLINPGSNELYYYRKREQDFIFCVRLSDQVKGVNVGECPQSERI